MESGNTSPSVVLITGASSGIGAAAAEYFAKRGWNLALCGRNETALEQVAAKCKQENSNIETINLLGDLTCAENAKSVVEKAVAKFGHLNSLVNSAGIVTNGGAATTPIENYDKVMELNVRSQHTFSVIVVTQQCIPHLIKTQGTIVNVSSVAGPSAFAGVAYYCMSKAAVDSFTKCLALELAPNNVRVNAVTPGVIVTEVHKRAGMNEEQYAAFLEHSKTTHALGRVGTAEEVAKAIGFLATSDSSFTTGHLLAIDGGRGIMTPR